MAKNEGWIKWYRKAEHNDVLKDEKFDKFHAFLYLVERANIEPVDIPIGTQTLHLERGQFFTSIRKLSKEWNWSLGKTHRFLGTLCGTHMIHTNGITNGTVITIENYSKYQSQRNTNGYTNRYTDGYTDGIQRKNIRKKDAKKAPNGTHSGATAAEKNGGEPPMGDPIW